MVYSVGGYGAPSYAPTYGGVNPATTNPLQDSSNSGLTGLGGTSNLLATPPSADATGGLGNSTALIGMVLQIMQLILPLMMQLMGGGANAFSGSLGGSPAAAPVNFAAAPSNTGADPTGNAGTASAPEPATSPSPTPDSGGPIPQSLQDIDNKYGATIDAAIAQNGNKVSKKYVEAEIMQESGGDAHAVGDKGHSLGILQINDNAGFYNGEKTTDSNYNPNTDARYDPTANINMAVGQMSQLSDQYHGDIAQMASAYETGGSYYDPTYSNSVMDHMNGN